MWIVNYDLTFGLLVAHALSQQDFLKMSIWVKNILHIQIFLEYVLMETNSIVDTMMSDRDNDMRRYNSKGMTFWNVKS